MRYFAFVDRREHLPVIQSLVGHDDTLTIVTFGVIEGVSRPASERCVVELWDRIDFEKLASYDITERDRVILSTDDASPFAILIEILSARTRPPSILLLTESSPHFPRHQQPNMVILDLNELALRRMKDEWIMLEARRRAMRLREVVADARRVAILTQNDPDPDAIASGMAVQSLLGRTNQTAPIVTFGAVTRNENLAMVSLLRTDVRSITPVELAAFDRVVTVDVQPPYFGDNMLRTVDAVIDHHPYPDTYPATFKHIDPKYGATSTILFEYLEAAEIVIDEALATALLYGVVTDTMNLSRDTSQRDFRAFTSLWPKANIQLLSSMSRPRLRPEELRYFVRAIKNRKIIRDMIFIWLDSVGQEDIIPRLADFGLQFGEAVWSVVGGVCDGSVVISLRYLGGDLDAGRMASDLFGDLGSAGGHKSAAKAVVPLTAFKLRHGLKNYAQVRGLLHAWFEKALAEEAGWS